MVPSEAVEAISTISEGKSFGNMNDIFIFLSGMNDKLWNIFPFLFFKYF